jgi:hypothetical protein
LYVTGLLILAPAQNGIWIRLSIGESPALQAFNTLPSHCH